MATSFSTLPIVDLSVLASSTPSPTGLKELSQQLYDVFTTTGFAYLINAPLSFSHEDVFGLARAFFTIRETVKMQLATRRFRQSSNNTYRGYFPLQPQQDNLKEGFEIGTPRRFRNTSKMPARGISLNEPNVWPAEQSFPNGRERLELLHNELQSLASTLLSLLAVALDKPSNFFDGYLPNSLSTLRLLHYPPSSSDEVKLCCTPHTDSGILTLLHQDRTGGLEVLNADNEWVAAPYVPGSIVCNIGDLLSRVSGGTFVATMHRVRASASNERMDGMGRFSVPFFFEPAESCVITNVDGTDSVVYGDYVHRKMAGWVEYQGDSKDSMVENLILGAGSALAVGA